MGPELEISAAGLGPLSRPEIYAAQLGGLGSLLSQLTFPGESLIVPLRGGFLVCTEGASQMGNSV